MKKIAQKMSVILLCSMAVPMALANETDALKTVQEMYYLGEKLEKGMEVIQLFADESLDRAFMHEAANSEGICAYNHDLLWQSQDPEYHRKLTFSYLGANKVKVNLGQGEWHEPSSVIYQMSCKDGVCKINDVIDSGESLKANIYKHCN